MYFQVIIIIIIIMYAFVELFFFFWATRPVVILILDSRFPILGSCALSTLLLGTPDSNSEGSLTVVLASSMELFHT